MTSPPRVRGQRTTSSSWLRTSTTPRRSIARSCSAKYRRSHDVTVIGMARWNEARLLERGENQREREQQVIDAYVRRPTGRTRSRELADALDRGDFLGIVASDVCRPIERLLASIAEGTQHEGPVE